VISSASVQLRDLVHQLDQPKIGLFSESHENHPGIFLKDLDFWFQDPLYSGGIGIPT